MNVAKWLLLALLALPLMELAVFIAVAVAIGFGWAFLAVVVASAAGVWVLRHAGSNHIARMRVAMDRGDLTALRADGQGGVLLLAGFLLLIPGFITDTLALLLLLGPLRRAIAGLFGRRTPPPRADGVVDLEPEQWRHVPEPPLERPREDNDPRRR